MFAFPATSGWRFQSLESKSSTVRLLDPRILNRSTFYATVVTKLQFMKSVKSWILRLPKRPLVCPHSWWSTLAEKRLAHSASSAYHQFLNTVYHFHIISHFQHFNAESRVHDFRFGGFYNVELSSVIRE